MKDGIIESVRRGWVSSPDERGTMDIIWACVSTLVLCLYSMLHLNVPSPDDRYWTIFWRKVRWAFLGLLAPELPALFACGQWASAKRSLASMRQMGHLDWTIEHSFYADSGGFILQPTDSPPFPITAKQLEYLVAHDFIQLPAISKDDICDKSNADHVAKLLSCSQAAWLSIQIIARAADRISVTPIELSTVAVVGCSLTTLWFWRRKPLDVGVPTVIEMPRTIAEVLRGAEKMDKPVALDTPLDFIEPDLYMSRKWSHTVHGWIEAWGLQKTPMQRIPNDRDPQPSNMTQHIILGIVTAVFASVHAAGWNFQFANDKEKWLWRINSLVMMSLLAVYGTAEVFICWKEGYSKLGLDTLNAYKRRWPACLWFFIPAFLYVCTRLVVIFESIWSMRSLPDGAFQVVQWTQLIPHI